MKINKYVVVTGTVCVLAVAMQGLAQAEDAEEADLVIADPLDVQMEKVEPEDEQSAEDKAIEQNATKGEKGFDLLVRVTSVRGAADVMNPDVGAVEPMVKNKAYPLGSVFRTGAGGSVVVVFSGSESVQMFENTEIVVLADGSNPKGRCARLVSGRIRTFLKDNLQEGQFSVETPNASCKNMAGRADFSLEIGGENERFEVKVVTGSIRLEGPQYTIGALRAANTVNVLTTSNRALSHLTGVSGDYKITLDYEADAPVEYDMSPKAVVKIWREIAPLGGSTVVSVLAVSPTGKARHRFAYVLGRGDILDSKDIESEADPETDLQILLQTEGMERKQEKQPQEAEQEDEDAPFVVEEEE